MTDVFELRSVVDGATLKFTLTGEGFNQSMLVTAVGSGFDVTIPAYVYQCPSLPDFLDEVSGDQPSEAMIPWETLEGEVRLEVNRDKLGHLFVVYQLRSPDVGSDRWWRFEGRLVLELGSMPSLCRRAREFWRVAM